MCRSYDFSPILDAEEVEGGWLATSQSRTVFVPNCSGMDSSCQACMELSDAVTVVCQ
jgi:hypothetical protein